MKHLPLTQEPSSESSFAIDDDHEQDTFYRRPSLWSHNILKHQPNLPFAQEVDYILGDLTFFKSEDARHLLEKLPGQKFLIQGNHDGFIRAYSNYFKTTAQILDLTVKPTACPFLPENLQLTLCHYPMVTWNHKPHGSIVLHGHCHGKLDEHNRLSSDFRFDVGIDGELAKRAGGFIPLELIYEAAMEKTGGVPFHQYAKQNYRSEVR